jgi:hypothetical protein
MHTYYDKHFFEFMPQGAPNFSWRIKKSDHQRNSISDSSSDDQGYRNRYNLIECVLKNVFYRNEKEVPDQTTATFLLHRHQFKLLERSSE